MRPHSVAAAAGLCVAASAKAIPSPPPPPTLLKRQQDPNSICSVFGIDFQGGGSYFINTNSNESFTLVSQFEGCNNDTASILLVNDQISDEYECTSVPTVPDDTSQMSTCPISKSQMTSGSWSILTIGNNGNGNPFSYERDFTLQCEPQQTATVTVAAPYTLTVQSTSTVKSTSTVYTTSSVPNDSTISSAATAVATYTPPTTTVTSTEGITRTFYRWTKTDFTDYIVFVVPSCMVPPRPAYADPWLRFKPTKLPLPAGVQFQQTLRPSEVRTDRLAKGVHLPGKTPLKRDADAPTVTSTATVPNNMTVTVTIDPTVFTDVEFVTNTAYTTLPPQTVYHTAASTVTAPIPTRAYVSHVYTRTYLTKTMYVVWTSTISTTPTATATVCKRAGGHFENGRVSSA